MVPSMTRICAVFHLESLKWLHATKRASVHIRKIVQGNTLSTALLEVKNRTIPCGLASSAEQSGAFSLLLFKCDTVCRVTATSNMAEETGAASVSAVRRMVVARTEIQTASEASSPAGRSVARTPTSATRPQATRATPRLVANTRARAAAAPRPAPRPAARQPIAARQTLVATRAALVAARAGLGAARAAPSAVRGDSTSAAARPAARRSVAARSAAVAGPARPVDRPPANRPVGRPSNPIELD